MAPATRAFSVRGTRESVNSRPHSRTMLGTNITTFFIRSFIFPDAIFSFTSALGSLVLANPLCLHVAPVLMKNQLHDLSLSVLYEGDLRINDLIEELGVCRGIDFNFWLASHLGHYLSI